MRPACGDSRKIRIFEAENPKLMAGSNFVDYVKIFARSGHGGAGSAHFRREKFVALSLIHI